MATDPSGTHAGEAAALPAWHTLEAETVAAQLRSDAVDGLSAAEAARRLETCGPNRLERRRRRGPLRMLAAQFGDFMVLVLIAAAAIAGVVGDLEDTLVIAGIVVVNAVIGFVQEFRAQRAMAALQRLAAAAAVVVRDGGHRTVPASELVPGDLVVLEAGQVVPADLRLVDGAHLRVGEAALTGESVPVDKTVRVLHDPALAVGDRRNMAFKGTVVVHGRAHGLVVATGMATEIGRIARLLEQGDDPRTPLQRRLKAFGQRIALAAVAICVVIFVAGLLRGEPPLLMLLLAVSVAVAAIPEALPAVITILLALGARRMAQLNALVRRLPAVETLGSVTWICSDKTGTLTQNRMRVEGFFVEGAVAVAPPEAPGPVWSALLTALALCNDARPDADGELAGDPTEIALWWAAADAGFVRDELEAAAPRIEEVPFDAERKRMTTLHHGPDGIVAYTKGAPEQVVVRCVDCLGASGPGPLDPGAVKSAAARMAEDGLRVLAVAQRRWAAVPAMHDAEAVERDLTLLGLVAMLDPPRPEARAAVATCRAAGITPVMVTGDHPATALAIARRLDIAGAEDGVLTGAELAALPEAELDARVAGVRVFARVDPAQKIRIVEALQRRGEFVAMTGDGVNDAPALRRADIGVAMGRIGTDVAREAASLVLLDDDFSTIVAAVREGRRIFDNIRKFIRYAVTCNAAEIWTIFLAPFLGLPIPLLPIHILWINLVTDGLPGLALAAEPAERGVMARPPRPPRESIFAHGMWQHMVWVGFAMAGIALLTQAWALHQGQPEWRTMVFTELTLAQMWHVLAVRSERQSLIALGLGSNRALLGAIGVTVALQLAVVYVPALNPWFETTPLSAAQLAFCVAVSSLVFVAVETEKWGVRRRGLYGS